MRLNVKKCKEIRMCFFKDRPTLPSLKIEGQALEAVSCYKVLGLVIQDNLKWNEHISLMVNKASKRLHILRVLKRGGIPSCELILIYYALVRSILEYFCIVWHNSLPVYLADIIERVQ